MGFFRNKPECSQSFLSLFLSCTGASYKGQGEASAAAVREDGGRAMEAAGRAETEGGASQGSRGGEETTAAGRGEGQRSLVKSTSPRLMSLEL